MSEILAGKNSVLEALRAGRAINKILLEKGKRVAGFQEILASAREQRINVQSVDNQFLEKVCQGQKHQGIVAYAAPKEYADLDEIIDRAAVSGKYPFLVLLDEVQDPHNFGAIIRSCEAAGADAIIITQRHCCPLTGAVARASCGAVEHVSVVKEVNLAQTVKKLKQSGYWVAGADMDGENIWTSNSKMDFPLALIIGGESKGLGRLIKAECDLLFSIPMYGKVNSLNASVAAALVIFEVVRKRTAQKNIISN